MASNAVVFLSGEGFVVAVVVSIISLPLSSENEDITKDVGGRQAGPVTRRGPLTSTHFGPSFQQGEVTGATLISWEAAASW